MKRKFIYTCIGVLTIIIIWLISSYTVENSILIPKINEVILSLKTILSIKSNYYVILNTIINLFVSVLISFILALFLSYISYLSINIENYIRPIIVMIKTIPVVAIIIILLVMVGNTKSPYYITSFVILPILYEGILGGYKNIDNNIKDEIKLLTKVNLKVMFLVYIPITLPYILTSLIQSIGLGLKVMIMAEYITQSKNTIGNIIHQERININSANIFAWTIILIVLILVVELCINLIRNKKI